MQVPAEVEVAEEDGLIRRHGGRLLASEMVCQMKDGEEAIEDQGRLIQAA